MNEWKKSERALNARYLNGQRRVAWDSESRGTYRIGARAKKAAKRAMRAKRREFLLSARAMLGGRLQAPLALLFPEAAK